jgi:hypothetical protein
MDSNSPVWTWKMDFEKWSKIIENNGEYSKN